MLLHGLAEIANAPYNTKCTYVGWVASARNTRGLLFYEKLGAQIVEQHGNRLTSSGCRAALQLGTLDADFLASSLILP
jgi:ribosomal protein S18 acetylase RimI-like enzyme